MQTANVRRIITRDILCFSHSLSLSFSLFLAGGADWNVQVQGPGGSRVDVQTQVRPAAQCLPQRRCSPSSVHTAIFDAVYLFLRISYIYVYVTSLSQRTTEMSCMRTDSQTSFVVTVVVFLVRYCKSEVYKLLQVTTNNN